MNIRTFTVSPTLPRALSPLLDIAQNMFWSWNPSAVALFQRIDLDLWEATYHNPVKLLGELSQDRLEELAGDDSFKAHMDDIALELEDYLNSPTWSAKHLKGHDDFNICYFSFEYGLHESLPIYSGGLGLLSGDHLKAASDLGLPLIAVGLLYNQGYFRQYLNADGWQQETYPEVDIANLPITLVRNIHNEPIIFELDYPGRKVAVQVWRLNIGRVTLFMLDTNLKQNAQHDRDLTAQLYGGDNELRIQQEYLLGIGGLRALKLMGIEPHVCHMNEGHSAFLALERIRNLMEERGLNFSEAGEIVQATNVFTTHTPVPAGNDRFPADLVDEYFSGFYQSLGLSRDQFMGLGREDPFDKNESFCMTVLALKLSAHANGVSELHGHVSRNMWKRIWPGLPNNEIPIGHVTNGVHVPGWISHELTQLFNRYLGPRWRFNSEEQRSWEGIDRIPDAELWRTHERRRERLVAFARRRLHQQLTKRGAMRSDIERAKEVLDPEALTFGFARRFATYKRGSLLFSDPDRLARILNDKDRPVQLIFAGKAHPRDNNGKEVIKQIVKYAREPRFRNRIVFLEDYDINVAHYLVQGVDVWINNPRRPLEASGTSGMKVSANGGLNLSVLDGWWIEAYNKENGWAIGSGEEYDDTSYQDGVESRALYDIIEGEVVPLFYQRGGDGLPRGWISMMKNGFKTICPVFNTNRMVIDYLDAYYTPGFEMGEKLKKDELKGAKEIAAWKNRIRGLWPQVHIQSVDADIAKEPKVGMELPIRVKVHLGEINPDEIVVEVYHGRIDAKNQFKNGDSLLLDLLDSPGNGQYVFGGKIPLVSAGKNGYGVRVLPKHELMNRKFEPGLVIWG